MFASKGAAHFAPIADAILLDVDSNAVTITLEVNGKKAAQGNTQDLYLAPAEVVSALSGIVTLFPGDVVFTGAVAISAPLKPGDSVAVIMPGVARVQNTIFQRH
jgi:2-keto-4-pentenoate hydratase/2-oxohepta-3-ene-1,7-dioic acid hydratase in catechol pathway